jgi:NADH-quinone oxidoreductase subunit N
VTVPWSLVSWAERRENHGEYHALLAAAGGMVFFVSAENLMTLFLGLEWFSLCLYILVAFDTERETSLEAGLKYLIVGGFGSAVLLFGSAFVYGATGELGFAEIAAADPTDDVFLLAGLAMILAGLAFKVSAAPFHMWTPDVYQGAPTSVTAFMSAATKRLHGRDVASSSLRSPAERDLTIRLRCSCAFHSHGAISPRSRSAREAAARVLVDLACRLHADGDRRGLGARRRGAPLLPRPLLRYVRRRVCGGRSARARASASGDARVARGTRLGTPVLRNRDVDLHARHGRLPFDGRLVRELFVFSAAYDSGEWWLVLVGVAATAVSLAYYLNVVRWMYMRTGSELRLAPIGGSPPADRALGVAVGAAVLVTVGSFFAAQPILDAAADAAASLPF